MIRGVVGLAGPQRKPSDKVPAPTADAESSATYESNQRRSIIDTRGNFARAPGPPVINIGPAAIVKRREPPRFIVHPGPAPGINPGPVPVVIWRPTRGDPWRPNHSIILRVAPIAVGIEVFIPNHVGRDVLRWRNVFHPVA